MGFNIGGSNRHHSPLGEFLRKDDKVYKKPSTTEDKEQTPSEKDNKSNSEQQETK